MEWIKCSDRLPEENKIVLISGGTAKLIDDFWYTGMEEPLFRRSINWTVTHWMPLPSAPQNKNA